MGANIAYVEDVFDLTEVEIMAEVTVGIRQIENFLAEEASYDDWLGSWDD